MKKIIFFSIPGHGHMNPTLPVIQELVKSGNKVICYSTDAFKENIVATGASYRSYDQKYLFDPKVGKNLVVLLEKLLKMTRNALPQLLDDVIKEKPDYILYDNVAPWGKVISHTLRIPSVSVITALANNKTLFSKYKKISSLILLNFLKNPFRSLKMVILTEQLIQTYNLPRKELLELELNKEKLNIVFTSTYYQPCSESFDSSYHFVGPSLIDRKHKSTVLKKIDSKKKIIYISIGTVNNDNIAFYRLVIGTFKNTPYQIILSLGHRFTLKDLPEVPKNFIIENHIPQLEILQRVNVFISHAGMNSTSESLYYGVPMILVPQALEQRLNAIRTEELGAGIYIKGKLTQKTLLEATEKVLQTKSFYENAAKIQKSLHGAGGYKKAAEEIINFIQ